MELGRRLFYDVRLSGNQTQSCASCHKQELAFTDGLPLGKGSTGQFHPRGAMGLTNIAYASTFAWANPLLNSLEEQALLPMFGDDPVELGLTDKEDILLQRLRDDALYPGLFKAAFPEESTAISVDTIIKAIASFERSLISFNAPYDQYIGGDLNALNDSEKRGLELFFSERLECFHCHGGFNFSDAVSHDGQVFEERPFHNTGLYSLDGVGSYPERNQGIFEFSGDLRDMGRFKAPSLRNIEVTAPYMHDGSIKTLDGVLDHYARGGRLIEDGDLAGDGSKNPQKSQFVQGFELTDQERADVLAFLKSLTDKTFLADPKHANPFEE